MGASPESLEWFHPEECSPVVRFELNGKQYECTWFNTQFWVFPEKYKDMSHVWYHREGDEEDTIIFDVPEVIDQLHSFGFYQHNPPFPTRQDMEMWIEWEKHKLDNATMEDFDGGIE